MRAGRYVDSSDGDLSDEPGDWDGGDDEGADDCDEDDGGDDCGLNFNKPF